MADKKLRDILPPQRGLRDYSKKNLEPEKKEKIFFRSPSFGKKVSGKRAGFGKKGLVFFLLFFLVFLAVFCYFRLPRAEIEIWPSTKNIRLEKELFFDQSVVRLFEREKNLADVFEASGKFLKEEKAEGTITVFNEYSTSPQTLIAATRFVSAEGKVFRTPLRVTIPGGTYEAGKFIPGEINIRVLADEPGPEYNIGPTTFSIPGFAGTDRYTKFYARSSEPMKGGFQEEVSKVVEADLARAEEILIERAKKECQDLIEKQLFDYFSEHIHSEVIESFSPLAAEEEAKDFRFQVKAKCRTLYFEKDYLENYAKQLIIEQALEEGDLFGESPLVFPSDKKLIVPQSLDVDYSPQETNLDLKEITLSLDASARTYSEVNLEGVKNALAGKTLAEANFLLESEPKIIKANLNFWPFWVKRVPNNPNRLNLSLRFD